MLLYATIACKANAPVISVLLIKGSPGLLCILT